MDLDQYVAAQADIVARIVRIILAILLPFRGVEVTDYTWVSILRSIFPFVDAARRESAELARQFYDEQRRLQLEDDQRIDLDLPSYEFDWFVEAMQPSRKAFRVIDTSEGEVAQAALRVAKEVENGGRRFIRNAAETDPQQPGWARVATGAETCAFCMMLVSRGPVYGTARDAGATIEDRDAMQLIDEDGFFAQTELMTRWHPGCDCKLVPVFNRKNWPGREQYLEMRELWKDVTGDFTGRDKLNAFRRAIEHNQVEPADFAAA